VGFQMVNSKITETITPVDNTITYPTLREYNSIFNLSPDKRLIVLFTTETYGTVVFNSRPTMQHLKVGRQYILSDATTEYREFKGTVILSNEEFD